MKHRKSPPSLQRLKDVLDYQPTAGKFFWKERTGYRANIGDEAGGPDTFGVLKISFDKETHPAHYLAWYYVYGEWPTKVKHKNGNRQDNRIDNLFALTKDPVHGYKGGETLTLERLRALIDYNPETGSMVWKISTSNRNPVGSEAGTIMKHGYRHISIDGKRYLAHRLAWFYFHGSWPKEIDHIDRDRSNNKLANLRLATRSQNSMNKGTRSDNKSGVTGVTLHKGSQKWRATIHKDGKQVQVGMFETIEEAAKAYQEAANEMHGEFANSKPEVNEPSAN